MRIPIAAILLAASALVVGSAQAQQGGTPDQKGNAFHRCTGDIALRTMRRMDGQIDKNRVVNEVLSVCFLEAADDVFLGPRRDFDAWMALAKREVAAQVEKLALRAKAEKAEKAEKADEDQVGANYFLCLERHAKALALAADEAADIVAQASLSACPAERAAVFEVHRRYDDALSEGAMKVAE